MSKCIRRSIAIRAAERVSDLINEIVAEEAHAAGVSMQELIDCGLLPNFYRLMADVLANTADMYERRN
jgi:hypothetical protein